jgi:hypothetical protein
MYNTISPSRTYVVVCGTSNYYLRQFRLPETDPRTGEALENSGQAAVWYFLNRLDSVSCVSCVLNAEAVVNLTSDNPQPVADVYAFPPVVPQNPDGSRSCS